MVFLPNVLPVQVLRRPTDFDSEFVVRKSLHARIAMLRLGDGSKKRGQNRSGDNRI
jgi:hypothetical protein